ncbi:MAG: Rne/Rng family ribonuclease [Sedimentisphaerales bacterium]|nr:Rne/Rng family ribonuclease [Sedimentisphaerales bacterium]
MTREMLINVAESEECRVAVIENGALEELYVERTSLNGHVGNIYKGKIANIESGIQAAFIDFGVGKNGFLHISDLHPKYFSAKESDSSENIGRRKALKERPPIQNCLHRGQEIVVQVTKEGLKTKGATLSTYLALPGKYLVMLPWMRKHGVSHKIDDEEERNRLRDIFEQCNPPKGQGFIIRTAGQKCSKKDIQNDLNYLKRLWHTIEKRIDSEKAPGELYQESDLVTRTLRDVYNSKISKIICDSEAVVRKIKDFFTIASPRVKQKVVFYESKMPLFHKYKIEEEITKIQSRKVELKGGGSIVIEQTEALVSIDVNSGRYRKQQNAEETAFESNIEAANEIARQLRLRDLGGLIICDFIDMRNSNHRKEVEKAFRAAMKTDRARTKVLSISRFGIIEMTRQRMRPSLQYSTYLACPNCGGTGFIKSHESLAIEIIRLLNLSASKEQIKRIELFVSPEVADYLQNIKRTSIAQIEQNSGKKVIVHSAHDYFGEKHEIVCYNDRGSVIKI